LELQKERSSVWLRYGWNSTWFTAGTVCERPQCHATRVSAAGSVGGSQAEEDGHLSVGEKLLELLHGEVAHADRLGQALLVQVLPVMSACARVSRRCALLVARSTYRVLQVSLNSNDHLMAGLNWPSGVRSGCGTSSSSNLMGQWIRYRSYGRQTHTSRQLAERHDR
jgi:hypothetical protein